MRQNNSDLSTLLPEFEFLILKALLLEDVDCHRVYASLMPHRRAFFAVEEEIRMLLRDENVEMIPVYTDLLPILHHGKQQEINVALDKWEEKNQNLPKDNAFPFFNHSLSSRKCLTLIKTIVGCSVPKPDINPNDNLLWQAIVFGTVISILSFFISVAFAAALTGGADFIIAFVGAFKAFTFATAFGIGAGIYSGLIGFSLFHIENSNLEEIEEAPHLSRNI